MATGLPEPTTIEGMYAYLLWSIVLMALLLGAYVVAIYAGLAPPPERLYGAAVAL